MSRPRPATANSAISLRDRLVRLVSIPSESRHERALADDLARRLAGRSGGELLRFGDELVFRFPALSGQPKLILCGHLDTVPAQGPHDVRVEGDRVVGLGASDLKAGLAVMEELAESLDPAACELDPWFVFYTCEEVGYAESGLERLRVEFPPATEAHLAVCVEPTSNAVEVGCLGTMRIHVRVQGRSAHSARPGRARTPSTRPRHC